MEKTKYSKVKSGEISKLDSTDPLVEMFRGKLSEPTCPTSKGRGPQMVYLRDGARKGPDFFKNNSFISK
jgi:hypothetical protein